MSSKLLKEYINKIGTLNDKEFLFANISYHIAPTIAKLKPSSIITLTNTGRNMVNLWEIYKKDLRNELGVEYCEIKTNKNSLTILFYDKKTLTKTLYKRRNMNFLKRFGYSENILLVECLQILKNRFQNMCPHEMGIFLGIPVDDVINFMDYPQKECLLCGYWKVYSNIEKAKKAFAKFDLAKVNVINKILNGNIDFNALGVKSNKKILQYNGLCNNLAY